MLRLNVKICQKFPEFLNVEAEFEWNNSTIYQWCIAWSTSPLMMIEFWESLYYCWLFFGIVWISVDSVQFNYNLKNIWNCKTMAHRNQLRICQIRINCRALLCVLRVFVLFKCKNTENKSGCCVFILQLLYLYILKIIFWL